MAAKRVDVERQAADEVRDAHSWYVEHSPKTAARFLAALARGYRQLSRFPSSGPLWTGGDTKHPVRTLKIAGFPYSIVYRAEVEVISVIALAHGSRLPGFWAGR